jgi:hypothetical protein
VPTIKPLTMPDFIAAAESLMCEVPAIQAVSDVESVGNGFLADGRCKILFEGHQFHRLTGGKYSKDHPAISYPRWDQTKYAKGQDDQERGAREWDRLNDAANLDRNAGYMSASWGRFQIMGFNYGIVGFTTITDFIAAMMEGSERNHLLAFVEYVRHAGLDDEIRAKEWPAFARRYNGVLWQKNNYATKLARAYLTRKEQWKNR